MQIGDLDARDRAILRELQEDGRLTNAELADRVGLSPSACLRRVRQLEESGLVSSYAMILDQKASGLPGNAFVFVTLDQQGRQALDAFEAAIGRVPEIVECYLLAGQSDYLVRVVHARRRRSRAHPYRDHHAAAGRGAGQLDAGAQDREEDDGAADLSRLQVSTISVDSISIPKPASPT